MAYIHVSIMFLSGFIALLCGIEGAVEDNDKEFNIGAISFFVCIASIVFFFIGQIKCEKSEWIINKVPYATEKIVALNDNNLTSGRFYLRRGYFSEDLYYQYMVDVGNGGFKANKVKSDNAILYYDTENYRVEWYKKTKSWLYFEVEQIYHEIYIPEGSIATDYSIDLS